MLKVLVVEDEELIRKGIVLAIDWASLDCVVVGQAANGEEGLEQAEKCRPGLIITDLKMPKMDGLEMIAQLRARGNDAFVIILTAYDSFAYAQQALRLGAVDFLLKPFHDGDLENAVMQLQNKLSQRRKPPEVRLQEIRSGAKTRYVQEAMDYIGKNCGSSELSVSQVAYALGLSEGHLSHLFKKETGSTVGSYLTRCRIQKAMGLLRQWASGSKEGEFFYSHAYDMLMGVAADCGEVEVRDAYLEDAERLLLETGYVCPLYFTGQSSRLSSAYTGLLTDGIGGYYFSYVVQQNNG